MSVMIVVNFQAFEGKGANLLALLQQGRDFSRKAEGCESFEVFRRQDDPDKFMFLEQWTSYEAHKENVVARALRQDQGAVTGRPDNGVVEAV